VIALVPLTAEHARRLVGGDLAGLEHAAGWPHEDTVDGLRVVEQGAAAWLVEVDDVVIGDCGTTGPLGPEVEIGFGLAAECRGRGHGTEVVRLLVDALREHPLISTVVARTLPENTASRRVLEKAGFAFGGERDGLARYVRQVG
jgi:RimJ/RimL family protein N-acetyltransferase